MSAQKTAYERIISIPFFLCLSIFLSFYLFICLSTYQFIYLSIFLHILYIYLSILGEELVDSLEDLSNSLEEQLVCTKESTKTGSERIISLCTLCTGYIDQVSPTARFRFRGLLNKLENLSKVIIYSSRLF